MTTQEPVEILYMFTSTAKPYIKDTLDLLALPSGVSYRFRYDIKWLPSNLFEDNDNKKKLKSLAKTEAFLIHVLTTPKPKPHGKISYQITEFIPIREAKILEASLVGDFVWMNFILGDWVDFDNSTSNSSQNPYHNIIKEAMPNGSKTELTHTALLSKKIIINPIPEDLSVDYHNSKVLSNWSKIVNYIGSKTEHSNSVFTKLLEIKDIDSGNKLKPKQLSAKEKIYGFALESEKTYQIKVLQRYLQKTPVTSFNLKIITNTDDVLAIKNSDKIQGKYDILRFIIAPAPLLKPRHSFLIIQPEENYSNELTIAHSFYQLKINVRGIYLLKLLIALTGGLALAGLGSTIADSSGIKELATILPVIGGFVTAVIAYLMPKR